MNKELPSTKSEGLALPHPKSSLNLFSNSEISDLAKAQLIQNGQIFKNHFYSARRALEALNLKTTIARDKSQENSRFYNDESYRILSMNSCRLAYIRLFTETTQQGATDQAAWDLFKTLLDINVAVDEYRHDTSGAYIHEKALTPSITKRITKELQYEQYVKIPQPEWFKGSRAKWFAYVSFRGQFSHFINSDVNSQPATTNTYITLKQYLPEWVNSTTPPDLHQIEAGLPESLQEYETNLQLVHQAIAEDEYLYNTFLIKCRNSEVWLQSLIKQRFPTKPATISQLIVRLDALRDVAILDIDIRNYTPDQMRDLMVISPDKSRQRTIAEFCDRHFWTREIIGLWVEEKLLESQVITSAQDPLTPELADIFQLVTDFAAGQLPSATGQEAKSVRRLKFALQNALSLLSSDDQRDLLDLIKQQSESGNPVEAAIWTIADYLHSASEQVVNSTAKPAVLVRTQLKEFSNRWLNRYWDFAYHQLVKPPVALQSPPVPPTTPEPIIYQNEITDELEKAAEKIDLGGLSGWKVIFNADRTRLHPRFLIALSGKSKDDYAKQLKQIYFAEHLTCTTDFNVLVNFLDYVANLPPEAEYTHMHEAWGEVDWLKWKNHHMRFLTLKDRSTKTIIFSSYHKHEVD